MRVLQIVDSPWSIGQLCDGIRLHNPQIDFKLIYIPPRDVQDHLEEFRKEAQKADLIDFQYWNVARQLIELCPEIRDIPKILTHHNEKNLLSFDQSCFEKIVVKTHKSFDIIEKVYPGKAVYIPNVTDLELFEFNEEYPPKEMKMGYVGRICSWKGLKEIARAGFELHIPVMFMGRQDKVDYWETIPQEYKDVIDFSYMNCTDPERPEFYKTLTFYIGNSSDNHEAGTLGFLEAMASGVPVITTRAGLANDIIVDGENGVLVEFDNYDDLKKKIQETIEKGPDFWNKLRENAWKTVKNFNYVRYGRQYSELYNDVISNGVPLVSVIIPATYDRAKEVSNILVALNKSTYSNIEAVVVWDEVEEQRIFNEPGAILVKELYTGREGYNLAMARNLGIIEAQGDILIFNDSRLVPDQDSLTEFTNHILDNFQNKIWFFGNKGSGKKEFVENFSAIRRDHIIRAGMFNERVNEYGGMSQELRSRFNAQGFEFKYLEEAKATPILTSRMNNKRRKSILHMKDLMFKLGL